MLSLTLNLIHFRTFSSDLSECPRLRHDSDPALPEVKVCSELFSTKRVIVYTLPCGCACTAHGTKGLRQWTLEGIPQGCRQLLGIGV